MASGITGAQAVENLAVLAGLMSCPTGHRRVVAVEDLTGDLVAALCLDCDRQLPPQWIATKSEESL